ncbi:lipocalin family protein [Defluviimonas sp. D31]|uniref:lipocalin family protein n=1 Tax=Defluviimonas sp. D31 TaxID=3083253 RepID=UPI00296F77DF|nr:lipocalin family protein [Defluviimonas sp. D31]MDW4548589.1 lipocalin family protein [Defluviimonas sp. D31]
MAFVLGLASAASAEAYRDRSVPIETVSELDIERYAGRWYEIARFPNSFEKGCVGVTADYTLRKDGQVSVLNTCRKGALDGPVKTAKGVARIEGPGKLSVTFVPWLPFARGDYWVLYLDADYSLVAIGTPRGKTGWILARQPMISAEQRSRAEAALRRNGYDTSKLIDVAQ